MTNGFFVTIEGIDGSGKTSVAKSLNKNFDNTLQTQEPSDWKTGTWVRELLKADGTPPLTDFYLFLADRVGHVQYEIEPALEDNKLVICDRYIDSTRAYQQELLNNDVKNTEEFIENQLALFPEPDLTLYLDIPVDVAMKNVDSEEKYENREFLKKVRQNYIELEKNTDRIVRVDSERHIEDVKDGCINLVEIFSDRESRI